MRALERVWESSSKEGFVWQPVELRLGSNIRGKRFKYGSVVIGADELEKFLIMPGSRETLLRWFLDLHVAYVKDT